MNGRTGIPHMAQETSDAQLRRGLCKPPVWLDGELVDPAIASVSIEDRGISHGLGVFETLLVLRGKPAFWQAHRQRLSASLKRLGWHDTRLPELAHALELLACDPACPASSRLRIGVSGGIGTLSGPSHGIRRRVWMTASALPSPAAPVHAMLCPWRRNADSPLVGLKSSSYAENLLALEAAEHHGCNETLWLNHREELCEATTANVFLVQNGVLSTPPLSSGCLPGITRAWVIANAPALGYKCQEIQLTLADLCNADEIILTSATKGPAALATFGQRFFETTQAAKHLSHAWQDAAAASAASIIGSAITVEADSMR